MPPDVPQLAVLISEVRGDRVALDVPDLRPAVLRPETRRRLGELLSFRHFFRHAYAVALDPVRLRELGAIAVALDPPFAQDLDRFEATLRGVIALERQP